MWICNTRQTFLVIENPKFWDMIADLSTDAADLLPVSADRASNLVVSEFKKQRPVLIGNLR
jgi:hypothetical protein